MSDLEELKKAITENLKSQLDIMEKIALLDENDAKKFVSWCNNNRLIRGLEEINAIVVERGARTDRETKKHDFEHVRRRAEEENS